MNTGFFIGWAKPVPNNPANLRNGKKGDFIVAVSGITANLLIAVIFGLLMRFGSILGLPMYTAGSMVISPLYKISTIIVLMNLVLAFFNLIPIPPLDGSKILFSILPAKFRYIENFLERWGLFLLLFFIVFVWRLVSPFIYVIFSLITGMPF
jgi:Zn-dependent protease